jgi:putative oxidoreductase
MDIGLLVLRAVVGLLFMGHGAQKLFGSFGGHGIEGTAGFFDSLGMRPGRRNAIAAGGAELAGGALLVLGLLTPLAAVMIISVMTVAIMTVHAKNGPWATDGGYEYNAVIMAVCFALVGAGPGEISFDDALGWMPDITGTGWAFGALAVGLLGGLGAIAAARATRGATTTTPTAATAGTEPTVTDAGLDERFSRGDRVADAEQARRPGIPADPR